MKARSKRKAKKPIHEAILEEVTAMHSQAQFTPQVKTFLTENINEIEKQVARRIRERGVDPNDSRSRIRASVRNLASDLKWQRIHHGKNAVIGIRGKGWLEDI
jgi:hypothetical protein